MDVHIEDTHTEAECGCYRFVGSECTYLLLLHVPVFDVPRLNHCHLLLLKVVMCHHPV